ncbi:hypothetical protein B4U79_18677 [Dinothrombium tinctorium]|uniref:Uncharacterized protein n=1 Tax=Dinothrombium tinctorium TaxID=1965070 RepID=A0A443QAV8_9ACAR|nr:hypothetical protein B4U79_18702 [Dinothrombium tinctorium]RWS00380.1 hypothetical protein B4U79_18677 [Dinothrombium tinctorium]
MLEKYLTETPDTNRIITASEAYLHFHMSGMKHTRALQTYYLRYDSCVEAKQRVEIIVACKYDHISRDRIFYSYVIENSNNAKLMKFRISADYSEETREYIQQPEIAWQMLSGCAPKFCENSFIDAMTNSPDGENIIITGVWLFRWQWAKKIDQAVLFNEFINGNQQMRALTYIDAAFYDKLDHYYFIKDSYCFVFSRNYSNFKGVHKINEMFTSSDLSESTRIDAAFFLRESRRKQSDGKLYFFVGDELMEFNQNNSDSFKAEKKWKIENAAKSSMIRDIEAAVTMKISSSSQRLVLVKRNTIFYFDTKLFAPPSFEEATVESIQSKAFECLRTKQEPFLASSTQLQHRTTNQFHKIPIISTPEARTKFISTLATKNVTNKVTTKSIVSSKTQLPTILLIVATISVIINDTQM